MRLLILGGTTEATQLARAISVRLDLDPTLSLAGRTAQPAAAPIPLRIGGFGGVAGLVGYIEREGIGAVVDATHPFAARISAHAVTACTATRVPLVAYTRPPWRAAPHDRWTTVPNIALAVEFLAAAPRRRVFLTTGRLDLAAFRQAPQHDYLIRSIDPPDPDICPARATTILGRGPFTVEDEHALLRSHSIDWLVTKNSGGDASAAKLEAARQLGLPALVVQRPAIPDRPVLDDLDAVLRWIDDHRA